MKSNVDDDTPEWEAPDPLYLKMMYTCGRSTPASSLWWWTKRRETEKNLRREENLFCNKTTQADHHPHPYNTITIHSLLMMNIILFWRLKSSNQVFLSSKIHLLLLPSLFLSPSPPDFILIQFNPETLAQVKRGTPFMNRISPDPNVQKRWLFLLWLTFFSRGVKERQATSDTSSSLWSPYAMSGC